MASPDTIILLIVAYHADRAWGKTPVAPVCVTPMTPSTYDAELVS